jgi:H+-translocating NAD(P) transhydrogenase subunit alpha
MVELVVLLVVLGVSVVLGYLLISRVPPLLHTPLMSMTNAISAVTLLGALLVFGTEANRLEVGLGGFALFLATFNMVGGFAVTDRMLKLFRKRKTQ